MKLTKELLQSRKHNRQKITMLTCYDFPTAKILDQCSVDVQLIGDSVGTNVLGYTKISDVTMADMLHHLKAVVRGAGDSFILCDMPFGSYDTTNTAIENAKKLIDAGANGVKLESEECAIDKIISITQKGIDVCAHIGYTPQTPGLKPSVQGKDTKRAKELLSLAIKSEKAGAFMIVLELIPEQLSKLITNELSIPTIGIGAGRFCDGQVQVILDIMGLNDIQLRHVKKFSQLSDNYKTAINAYVNDVQNGRFPTKDNISKLPDTVLEEVAKMATGL